MAYFIRSTRRAADQLKSREMGKSNFTVNMECSRLCTALLLLQNGYDRRSKCDPFASHFHFHDAGIVKCVHEHNAPYAIGFAALFAIANSDGNGADDGDGDVATFDM